MKTLILTKEEVGKLLNMKDSIESVEEAYRVYGHSLLQQPQIVSIDIPLHSGELDIKSCYSMVSEIISIKSASGFWNNEKDYNLPTLLATITLLDGKSGYPLCIMDGSLITGYRTGAAGGLSAKLLAKSNSKSAAVIGAGNQARMQLRALKEVFDIKEVFVWSPLKEEMLRYKNEMESELELAVYPSETVQEAVENADIIITATPGKKALVEESWVKDGTHIIAVGADMEGKQELDTKLFRRARIFVDSKDQCLERGETRNSVLSGDISPGDIYAELYEVILGEKLGRISHEEITIFDTTGMGIQDNTLACQIYKKALESGIGKEFDLLK